MHREASAWLAQKGSDQWQPMQTGRLSIDHVRSGIARSIAKGECFIVLDDQEPIGTITLDSFADPEFWTDEDDPGSALYVHRMIVKRSHAGRGIGGQLLHWANDRAKKAGRRWLRLDAWRTNPTLHEYYRSQGFEQVRVVDLPHRGSGALFQRAV
ncbi:GNAT family N-acetyltransferase [Actinoplanes sp. NEAU-A11]|uniref:GNAT family N-acetyltransferase n=2 Tax=Actinoplanes aureus TaxID=2792083 RepID=A0A931CN18_9ACTN|nr:GNAT family N-acetyltransferase [Actinoplanes aureus]